MRTIDNKKILYNELLNYGFINIDNKYIYEKEILDGFKIIIEIKNDIIKSKVIDLNIDEEYTLVDVDSSGNFVGKIKEIYNSVINNFIDNCTSVYKNENTNKIIAYIKEKYDTELEFLWNKFPTYAVGRNKNNNKWYLLIATISKDKLGINSNELIDIINLRYNKEDISNIIDNKNIFRAYHMNKNNWISVIIDDNIDKIIKLIDNSYELNK